MAIHNIHRAVKEKSMHHMKREARKSGGATMVSQKEGGSADYGGGFAMDKEPEDDVKRSYTMPGDKPVYDAARGEEGKGGGPGDKDIKKRGGKVEKKAKPKKEMGKVEGETKAHRMDRPARKRGGGVGADMSPLTTASKITDRRGPSKGDDDRGITGEPI